jgi:hypothetical protein
MADFEGRLKAESERYMALLEKLGEKLTRTLPVDCNDAGTPSRDWARSFGHYSQGVRGMLGEQRERVKLRLLAHKQGDGDMTDDEYNEGMRQLQIEAVRELPEQELRTELERRGVPADALVVDSDGDAS